MALKACSHRTLAALLGVIAALVTGLLSAGAAYGQAPADGARFAANVDSIEFLAGDDLGERHRLKIARDPGLQDVVYDRPDADDLGLWFVSPRSAEMTAGVYYWQACWLEDLGDGPPACTPVRSLRITRPQLPTLTLARARAIVREVYDDHGAAWEVGNGKRYRCSRLSRVRVSCRPSAWAGDTVVTATLSMRNRMDGATRVVGRIAYFSSYCKSVTPWKNCTDVERIYELH